MKKKTIAIDMDNVIADTVAQYIAWYERDYGVRVERASLNGIPELDAFPGGAIRKFLYTPGFFRTVPVIPGAQEAVQKLMEHFEVYIASAALEFPLSLHEKYEWLQEHFPFISWRNIIFCGDKSIIGTDYMIDDHVKNLDVCKGKTFIFTAGHNINIDRHTRVNDWNEVVSLLMQELQKENEAHENSCKK
jgi:5'-nucleotidase